MNDVQKRAWEAHAARWLIEREGLRPGDLAGARLFGRDAPLVIEIGSGMGDATAAMAAARPEINILAIEVYKPGIAQTFAHLARCGVDHVRVLRADAAEVLRTIVIPGSLAELWLFFPDPWRKRKHHKRRIVTPEFADLVATRLAPGGSWYLATDWEHYAHQMLRVLSNCGGLVNPHVGKGGGYDVVPADAGAAAVGGAAPGSGRGPDAGWAPRPWFRPQTRFERRGLAADRTIFDLHVIRPA